MKALNLYSKQDVRFEDVDIPEIESPDEILIKVKVAGICGSDISRFGKLGSYQPGLTWGHEFSGVVAKRGDAVSSIDIGDRVTACNCFPCNECNYCKKGMYSRCNNLRVLGGHKKGAFAEFIKVPVANVVKIPSTMDFETASFIEPSSVVAHGYNQLKIKKGSSIAVVGCGTIGLLAVQWAKIYGASEVFAFDTDTGKLDIALQTGAHHGICANKDNYLQYFMAMTENAGVDVVIECSGSAVGISTALMLAKKGGTVLLLGIPYGDVSFPRESFEKIIRNELTVAGSWNSLSAPFPGDEWRTSLHYLSSGDINVKPLITRRIAMAEAPSVFPKLYNREEFFVKVLICMVNKNDN
ncbi:galactitol-1-phosphate 5-dehydrogenase [Buttiauxella warmboldiae]|uniref:Galactitol-1-phosphate 5-dehydrogenase n=1 Tax=Buttiauxella warmboldiae TaxID=82993 RepID=A0A3N5EBT7_9ENTR|nr:galactitol-1-phosphate 5-dehydrogenase [Buttiauxella warmboldiae]RPH29096.1 galactitol-1-phosphate 5-dehydrogenase [Buttiauxella warmboldiae]